MSTHWNDEVIEQLTKLWKEGVSASQIATILGSNFTKNAVIGKIHRLKLSNDTTRQPRPRSTPKKPKSTGVSRTRRAVARVSARSLDQFHTSRLHVEPIPDILFLLPDTEHFGHSDALMALKPTSCKWPVGDPLSKDFRFCGAHAHGSYCAHHQSVAYRGTARVENLEKRYA